MDSDVAVAPSKNQEPIVPLFQSYEDVTHEHNSWDVVRKRNNRTTLRCRECQFQVKIQNFKQCKKFVLGRCTKEECRNMHVHPQKMNLRERVIMHGKGVLDRVPHDSRMGLDDTDAPPTLLDPDDVGSLDDFAEDGDAACGAAASYMAAAAPQSGASSSSEQVAAPPPPSVTYYDVTRPLLPAYSYPLPASSSRPQTPDQN
eukprot:TRINITY_DN21461_c0_g1_i1.p1 TRINITY_DN21461_c0_g1~~TRINITY_DN21461_c0_g1_i1.p1  ORF type:complete len:201 (+),score=15.11 TRINITY_DN21461_c0_g1_i1:72-674(+)